MMLALVNTTVDAKKASVSLCCKIFGVSHSGLYAARQRSAKQVSALDMQAKAAFEASAQTYGSRRLSAALKAQGLAVGRYKARRLMRSNGLRARWQRKFTHTIDSRHSLPVTTNVLERQFTPVAPNHGLIGSMSQKGNCWDNAVMERFFLNLKMERVWQRDYANYAETQAEKT